ncbi:MAG: MaoC family dehydratase N-terminal domain-containing protein [Actinomycetota bacterium]|nr:MaoC family dehydratase N-terminal domain-containing protein [Actinomycetota bacterium]
MEATTEAMKRGTPPATVPLFAKAALGALARPRRIRRLPDTALVLPEQVVDRDHLAAYARVCGFPLSDRLPGTYPHVLGFGLALQLMTGRDFPFPLLGLLHIANRITVRRAIRADERLTLQVRATDLETHDRGNQFTLGTEVIVDGAPVWSERSAYLRRSGDREKPRGAGHAVTQRPAQRPAQPPEPTAMWQLTEDAGRRYAAVSGDYNPIHLHRLTARAFGFRQAIAHGMYTKARCLAALDARLPESYTVDVRFGRPVLLPATVHVSITEASGGWNFAVHNPDGRSHLTGAISA